MTVVFEDLRKAVGKAVVAKIDAYSAAINAGDPWKFVHEIPLHGNYQNRSLYFNTSWHRPPACVNGTDGYLDLNFDGRFAVPDNASLDVKHVHLLHPVARREQDPDKH